MDKSAAGFNLESKKTMTKIIGIIQVKGGAGRSTVATNIAGVMAQTSRTVLIDCDMPQGTSASWYSIRKQTGKAQGLILATATNHTELVQQVEQHSDSDLIIIDCPPRIAEITRAALILCDLCLVPIGASAAEIWATSDLLKTIEEAKSVKPGVDARLVWNRFRSATSSAQELTTAVREGLGLAEMKTKLALRVAYSDALARGLTVTEWPEKAAREEMNELTKEISKILKL